MMPGKWDALKTHEISAQDFRDPLMLVLAEMSGFEAGISVDHETTYDPVCKAMGLTLTQYGKADSADIYWVERWIQEAFKALIRFDLADRTGRGQWALTEKGIERARALIASKSTESPMSISTAVNSEDRYHEDPYIRALAIKETPCFGMYSSASQVCLNCTFQFNCINAQSAEFSRLNQTLLYEESDAYKQAAAIRQATELASAAMETKTANKAAKMSVEQKGGRIVTAQVEACCAKCGKTIPLGSKAVWVKSNATSGGHAGMYHEECFKQV